MKMEERTPFGQRLVKARGKRFTQVAAAKAVGMSQAALAEAETTGHSSGYTAQLAQLYGVDSVYLASGETSHDARAEHAPAALSDDEALILRAFGLMGEEARDIWLTTAQQVLAKKRRTKSNRAA